MSKITSMLVSQFQLENDGELYEILKVMDDSAILYKHSSATNPIEDLESLGLCTLYEPEKPITNGCWQAVGVLTPAGRWMMEKLTPEPRISEREVRALQWVTERDKGFGKFNLSKISVGKGAMSAANGRTLIRIERDDMKKLEQKLIDPDKSLGVFRIMDRKNGEEFKEVEASKLVDIIHTLDNHSRLTHFPDEKKTLDDIQADNKKNPGQTLSLGVKYLKELLEGLEILGIENVEITTNADRNKPYILKDLNKEKELTKNIIAAIAPVQVVS